MKSSEDLNLKMQHLADDIDAQNLAAIVETFNEILSPDVSDEDKTFAADESVRDSIYESILAVDNLEKSKEESLNGIASLALTTQKSRLFILFKLTEPRDPKKPKSKPPHPMFSFYALRSEVLNGLPKKILSGKKYIFIAPMVVSRKEKKILLNYCEWIQFVSVD